MVARVLFILLESWGNTTTPYPRATVKALPTPHRPPLYELLTSWLFQTFDDKLNKMASDTMEDENIVDFVCNRPP